MVNATLKFSAILSQISAAALLLTLLSFLFQLKKLSVLLYFYKKLQLQGGMSV
jgi:hypothetical protein